MPALVAYTRIRIGQMFKCSNVLARQFELCCRIVGSYIIKCCVSEQVNDEHYPMYHVCPSPSTTHSHCTCCLVILPHRRGQSGFADEPTIYSCSECSREFSSSDYSSAFAAHEAKEQHERDAHPQWDVYTCDDCGREFSEENYASSQTACFAMEQHVRDAHPRWDVYTCDDCGREFSEQNYSCSNSAYEAREQHMRDVHGSYY